jgi:hypothetical protein
MTASEIIKLEDLVPMNDPQKVIEEIQKIVFTIYPGFDFDPAKNTFHDVLKLFRGEYPGYRQCTLQFHDLKHTTDCLMAMARLIHGAFVEGVLLPERDVSLGLIAALMHDTGYIQTSDDMSGTGAKYTLTHVSRSIEFCRKYFSEKGFSLYDFEVCRNCLNCTGLDVHTKDILFDSPEHEIIAKMLGTSDLLGQMADRTYLSRLTFLFREFKEGGVPGFGDELDLLRKTPGFWEFTRKRFAAELDSMDHFMRNHFRVRWGIDRDLYLEAIENHIKYLQFLLEHHPTDYRKYLRRGGFMGKPGELEKQS